ncbi:MAG TPA: hypothetical protein PKI93_05155 [Alphaproteobacteria bacterium]|nr:hypothetical protein [Alphaproteobacteria bacterium]HNS44197.1 hypothetical protein [Alphaproteobacteria bacterium]
MKIFTTLVLLVLLAPPAHAQTPITEEMALKYYDNCLANAAKEGTMSEKSRENYCFCTANQMKNNMTQEDLKTMSGEDPQAARATVNKVLIDVNTPCTQYPLHDLVYNECMSKVKSTAVCACLSQNISGYIATREQQMMADILKKNPNIYDPLGAIMETDEYKRTEKSIMASCISNPKY